MEGDVGKKSFGIVGGGILGMTLALRLAEKGFSVTLIESDSRTGGLTSSLKIGNYTWDTFYHVILMSDRNLLNLLAALGLKDNLRWGQTKTGFFTDGRLYSMSNSIEFVTFPPLNFFDKLRLGWTIFYASKIRSWHRLEKVLVTDWLRGLSGKRTFNKIWLPLLKSKLGENYLLASASFIWAIIARMYAARRSGLKKEMFGYVDGGYAAFLDRFQQSLDNIGVQTLYRTTVTKITDNDHDVTVESREGQLLKFDEVILTIPCVKIPVLCPQISHSESERFRKVTYQGIICASLILKKPLADYYVTNITDGGIPFTAVIEMTALVDRKYFGGNSLVYLPRYVTAKDPFLEKTDTAIKEDFISALESMYPSFRRTDCLSFVVSRAAQILPITTLYYSSELLPPTRTSLKHVFVANSAQIPNGTMNVNEIIGLANRKSIEILSCVSMAPN